MTETVKIATAVLFAREQASQSCVSATPDHNGYVPPGSCDAFYEYYPSFAAAGAAAGLFGIATLAHIFLAFYHKKGFCWVISMGTLWEFLAFAARTLSTKKQQNKGLAVQSFMLFTLAPLWINAFVYMVAGRLIFCFHPTKRVLKFKAVWIGRIFILADFACFLVQMGGALLISPGASPSKIQTGLHIYQGGLGLQQAFVVLFLAVLIAFHVTMSNLERSGWRDSHSRKWWLMTYILYFVLFLITLRIIYRLVEYIIPHEGNPLLTHEYFLYVLDAIPMFIAILALIIVHPGTVLVGPGSNYRADKKALKAQEKAAKKAGKNGFARSAEEESMMGVELHQPVGGNWAASGQAPTAYSPLNHSQDHGVVGGQGQGTLYDPHYGRM